MITNQWILSDVSEALGALDDMDHLLSFADRELQRARETLDRLHEDLEKRNLQEIREKSGAKKE